MRVVTLESYGGGISADDSDVLFQRALITVSQEGWKSFDMAISWHCPRCAIQTLYHYMKNNNPGFREGV